MRDFDYDVMQKKRLVASARKKVNGSKSRYCRLPSDNLTPAQIKARSGPCMSFHINAPMEWKVFKTMATDLQQRYLDGLSARFGVGMSTVSVELFHMSGAGLTVHAKRNGLKMAAGKRLNATERKEWENWLNQVEDEEPLHHIYMEMKDPEPETVPCETVEAIQDENPLEVSEMAATFTGQFDPTRFLKWLAMLPMPDGKVRIRVEVTRE